MSSHYKYLNNYLILITNVHKFPFLETTPSMSILKRYHLMEVRGHCHKIQIPCRP